ncbi:MAG: pimeloyl-ACP methyl ester esterase BioH [Pseudomonadota bacterium]|nr:pimeloyl-ACP methyl ester esterase BioH [Pseudomonadota bacterium]
MAKHPVLHVDVQGDGPDLVLLHGWGMHSDIWSDWARQLGQCFRIHRVDLPGHGGSPYQVQGNLDEWATAVLEVVPEQAWWLGWSLGGLVSLAAAGTHRGAIRGLTLLATTPRFVAGTGWRQAVDAQVFDQFAKQLQADVERTLVRFLSLQVKGAEHSAETLRCLRSELRKKPQPDSEALSAGLRFLQQADMRHVLAASELPLFWLLGERDTLVPAEVRHEFPAIQSSIIPGAGHAPFLSHPGQCAEQLTCWLLRDKRYRHHAAD